MTTLLHFLFLLPVPAPAFVPAPEWKKKAPRVPARRSSASETTSSSALGFHAHSLGLTLSSSPTLVALEEALRKVG